MKSFQAETLQTETIQIDTLQAAKREALLNGPICTDVDDVLLDWLHSGFKMWSQETLGRKLDDRGPDGWNMSGWLGVDDDTARRMIGDFNNSEHFATLSPFPDAVQAMRELAAAGRRIHAVTSCSSDPLTVARRRRNLDDCFGDIFASLTCLDLGTCKTHRLNAIAEAEGRGVFVEDSHSNAVKGHGIGYATFLIRRGHNVSIEATCDVKGIEWVDCWKSITPRLIGVAAA